MELPYYLRPEYLGKLGLGGKLAVADLIDTTSIQSPNVLSRILSVELLIRDD